MGGACSTVIRTEERDKWSVETKRRGRRGRRRAYHDEKLLSLATLARGMIEYRAVRLALLRS